MPFSVTTSSAALSLPLKKPKSSFIYKASFIGLFSLALVYAFSIPMASAADDPAAADLSAPPKLGEKTTERGTILKNPPPTLPEQAPTTEEEDSRHIPQPEVNIIHKEEMTIEEYRVNGRLRYVKITPTKGKPYYLVDKDGDGELETRHNDLDGIPPINEWILMKW